MSKCASTTWLTDSSSTRASTTDSSWFITACQDWCPPSHVRKNNFCGPGAGFYSWRICMPTRTTEPMNEAKLHEFVMKAVGEMGAAMNAALILVRDKVGLYKGMAGAGPMTSAELAEKTGTHERYVREWLAAQAAGGFVTYDAVAGRYTLPPEQAFAMADENSPVFLPGFFEVIEACF